MISKTQKSLFIILMSILLSGCGNQIDITTEPPTTEAPTEPIEVTQLPWETPTIELGTDIEMSTDARTYVYVEDDSLYDNFYISTNLDCFNPGTYTVTVSGFDHTFNYDVNVIDTTYPTLVVGNSNYIVEPEFVVDAENVMTEHHDNDPEYDYGFYGLEKIKDLEDFSLDEVKDQTTNYEETIIEATTELQDKITLPSEDGYYTVYAAVKDRAGYAVISKIGFIVDGTPPTITIPKDKIKLDKYKGYNFESGVSVTDNLKGIEYNATIDENEFAILQEAYENETPGTYMVTYRAKDFVGNETTKSMEVTLE